ncbi:MAG: acetolactate synthase large subunit, partial [Gammaproteobacteria bacterium]|nr:acetolactate synthase large subunit [Gammaproteobacteria bacterium]
WNEAESAAEPLPVPDPAQGGSAEFDAAVQALRSGEPAALLMNGVAVSQAGLELAGKIAVQTGARLLGDTFITRIARGAGRVDLERVPYFAEQAEQTLKGLKYLILVGTKAPVTFFAYPGQNSHLTPEGCEAITLTTPEQDSMAALEALAEALSANGARPIVGEYREVPLPTGDLNPASIAQTVAHFLPEDSIIVNESATSGFAIPDLTATSAPHDWLDLTGGAIGYGLPCATGAAVACPQRKVIALEADGSGMYTLQALWTHAREKLDITTVIFSNRKYAILQVEFMRVGAHNPGPKAMSMLNLDNPDLNWVELARGLGVASSRATTADEFNAQFEQAVNTTGPYLIEAVI